MLADQEMFDTVAKHLFTQGRPAISPSEGTCKFRTNDGLKCAAGCLIPDDLYRTWLEGGDVYNSYVWTIFRDNITTNQLLLYDLQKAHDEGVRKAFRSATRAPQWESTEAMRARLRTVALNYGLNADILETLSFEGR